MDYVQHLKQDERLASLIKQHGSFSIKQRKQVYFHLCSSIMSQQLSTKVAAVFHQRFLNLYDGKIPSAEAIVNTPFETLRGIGLSNAKAQYIQNVAQFEIQFGMQAAVLKKMGDEEVIQYLTQIKGVGRWTVEMLLMFTLGRENVFPVDDLGIQQAMINLYQIKYKDKKSLLNKMQKIAASWAPYRTYACMHLWHYKDN